MIFFVDELQPLQASVAIGIFFLKPATPFAGTDYAFCWNARSEHDERGVVARGVEGHAMRYESCGIS